AAGTATAQPYYGIFNRIYNPVFPYGTYAPSGYYPGTVVVNPNFFANPAGVYGYNPVAYAPVTYAVPTVPAATYGSYAAPVYTTYAYPTTYLTTPTVATASTDYYTTPIVRGATAPAATPPTTYGALAAPGGARENALVDVRVPDADAEVWFQGTRTSKRGTLRGFVSPALEPGRDYAYDVRATWRENGREVTRNKTIQVRGGSKVVVDFTQPDGAGASR